MLLENEKINEKNNELIIKISNLEKGPVQTMVELEESISEFQEDLETLENQMKRTSIDQDITTKKNKQELKTESKPQSKPTIEEESSQQQLAIDIKPNQDPPKGRHIREGSLFNEIIALKNIEIIDDGIFEEGFEKINKLNTEMKFWQRKSEVEISTQENTLNKPLLTHKDKGMLDPDKNMRSLFKSRQLIVLDDKEKKEKKKNEISLEKEKNPYEEFFLLVLFSSFFLLLSYN